MSFALAPVSRAQTTRSEETRFSRSADAEITFQEGLLEYNRKQLPEAEANFRKVIAADTNDAEAYYYLGLAQVDQSKPTDAIDNFNRSLLLDPTRQEARAARATAEIRAGKLDLADADINHLAPDPRYTSLVHYLRGQVLMQRGDLEGARKEFAAAKAAGGTEAEPANFYEGLTYLKLRQNVRARAAFKETIIDPERDPTVANAARTLDAALAAQEGIQTDKRLSGTFTLSYVYDSNVVQLGGVVAGVPSNQGDSRMVIQPSINYLLLHDDKLDVSIQGAGYFAYQFHLNDFDIASYQIGPYVSYRLSQNVIAGLQYAFNYIEFGHDPYLNRNIVTPSLTIVEPKIGAYTQIYYQFEARQFAQSFDHLEPTAADLDAKDTLDRDGQVHTFGLTQSINTPEIFKDAGPSNVELTYRLSDYETRGSDYDALTNSIGIIFSTPLPFWKLKADAGVNYEADNYRHPNSLDSVDHHQRFDQILNASVGVQREIFKGCNVRVDYNYTNSNSNVDFNGQGIYDYDRHQVGVRLIYNF
jgi:superkiller protein 3